MCRGTVQRSQDLSRYEHVTYRTLARGAQLLLETAVHTAVESLALWTPLWGFGPSNHRVSSRVGRWRVCRGAERSSSGLSASIGSLRPRASSLHPDTFP